MERRQGRSCDSPRRHRKHNATGVLLHLSCDRGGISVGVTKAQNRLPSRILVSIDSRKVRGFFPYGSSCGRLLAACAAHWSGEGTMAPSAWGAMRLQPWRRAALLVLGASCSLLLGVSGVLHSTTGRSSNPQAL